MGLACCEVCEKELNEYNMIMDRGKILYGMDGSGSKVSVSTLLFFAMGLIISGTGVYKFVALSRIDFISLLIGLSFLILGFISYRRNKKIGISL
jgi:hypothetical protein